MAILAKLRWVCQGLICTGFGTVIYGVTSKEKPAILRSSVPMIVDPKAGGVTDGIRTRDSQIHNLGL
jgi:hypothetical protein